MNLEDKIREAKLDSDQKWKQYTEALNNLNTLERELDRSEAKFPRNTPEWQACKALGDIVAPTDNLPLDRIARDLKSTELDVEILDDLFWNKVVPVSYQWYNLDADWGFYDCHVVDDMYNYDWYINPLIRWWAKKRYTLKWDTVKEMLKG